MQRRVCVCVCVWCSVDRCVWGPERRSAAAGPAAAAACDNWSRWLL